MNYNSFVYDLTAENEHSYRDFIGSACVVHFRPDYSYDASFGFDWLRVEEAQAQEPAYRKIIQGGYKNGIVDLTSREAYNKLKKEYKQLRIQHRFPGDGGEPDSEIYFVPYLNLFSKEYSDTVKETPKPPHQATLAVYIEVEREIEKLEFVYNEELFSVDTSQLLTIRKKCKQTDAGTIRIECKKDFSQEELIEVYALSGASRMSKRTLAGRLIVCPNSAEHRRRVEFVFVGVRISIHGKPKAGEFFDPERNLLCRTLHQALIMPVIYSKQEDERGREEEIVLDLTNDLNFLKEGKYIGEDNRINVDIERGSVVNYLKNKFIESPLHVIYKECFPIFSFATKGTNNTAGQAEAIGVKNVALFKAHEDYPETLAHEVFHTFGLLHTHRERNEPIITNRDKKYIYPDANVDMKNSTDNIMSYNKNLLRTTWKWQWNIIKKYT